MEKKMIAQLCKADYTKRNVLPSSSTIVSNGNEPGISRFSNLIELNSDLFEPNYSEFGTHNSELGNIDWA